MFGGKIFSFNKKFIIIFPLIVVTGLTGIISLNYRNRNTTLISPNIQVLPTVSETGITPTPFPFIEMTIPYLRSRRFKSSLGSLEKISENQSYSTYLTNYDSDGLKINGLLTIPIGQKPANGWPAIVFVHGYIPPRQYQTSVNYSSYVDYLGRNGFVVFKIDLRGHAESEGEPGGAYYSSDYIIDTLNARAALSSSDFVNSQKIGLWGHSMAGNVVFRSFVSRPDIPAVVIWAGAVYSYSDMQKYGINDGSYQPPQTSSERQRKRQKLRELYGDFRPESFFWQQVAATNYLNDIKGSLQLNHAVDDNVVSINYSRDLINLLNEAKISSELKEYSSGGHNLTGATFNQAMQNTIEFYKKHL